MSAGNIVLFAGAISVATATGVLNLGFPNNQGLSLSGSTGASGQTGGGQGILLASGLGGGAGASGQTGGGQGILLANGLGGGQGSGGQGISLSGGAGAAGIAIGHVAEQVVSSVPVVQTRVEPYDHHPVYGYAYTVHDSHTGDYKHQFETRHGDSVRGQYSLAEPDGSRRTVDYASEPHTGFNAVVHRTSPNGH